MENLSNVYLRKVEDKDVLFFEAFDKTIDLNSEDQVELRSLFYKIVEKLFTEKVVFKLVFDDYDIELFKDIATEYIRQLNIEIESISNNLPAL